MTASRERLYDACDRLGLRYWRSAGNFVLIDVSRCGPANSIAAAFADRGILVRDRSGDSGCDGCIRITAGLTTHTDKAIEVLEDVCGAG